MTTTIDRRQFLQIAGAGAASLALTQALPSRAAAPAAPRHRPPNMIFINADQMNFNALSGHGCTHARTPNIDRLMARGTSFHQSYTVNPVCCPARSGWFSGRPSSETGARGGILLREGLPDLGVWLRDRGYESVYAGKWHVPGRDCAKSFRYLTPGSGMGENTDAEVSRAAQGFLRNYGGQKPFFLAMGFLQPHDICYWIMRHYHDIGTLPVPEIAGELPPLPPNFVYDVREPAQMIAKRAGGKAHKSAAEWSELHWRYYLWSYYRHVEMVDAEVGRVLDALEDSAFAKDTLVVFSVDHGEGMGCHQMVIKGYLYDEAARVPLVVSWPGALPEGVHDKTHLASGLDLAPTLCDFAGAPAMPKARGLSLRPLLEGRGAPQREFIAAEAMGHGFMIRTPQYKYISYPDDPVCQLFDMQADPWETKNLAPEMQHAAALAEMKKHETDWLKGLERNPGAPVSNGDEGEGAGKAGKAGKAKADRKAKAGKAGKAGARRAARKAG